MKLKPTLFLLVTMAMGTGYVGAATYSGSLSTDSGGLIGTGQWSDGVTFSWTVTEEGTVNDGAWKYSYTLDTSGDQSLKDISHMIIEVSVFDELAGTEQFTLDNFFEDTYSANPGSSYSLDTYSTAGPGNSNPGLPSDVYGLKFDVGSDSTTLTIMFESDRGPTWGDMYAKDGRDPTSGHTDVYLYNAGFASDDPLAAPADGTINNHILRPDSCVGLECDGGQVPEPGAASFLTLAFIYALQRRKR